jgi:hypothetical protein
MKCSIFLQAFMAFCEGAEADMHMFFEKAGKYVHFTFVVVRFSHKVLFAVIGLYVVKDSQVNMR